MAESSNSPAAISVVGVPVDLHANIGVANENSNGSVNTLFPHNVDDVGVDLQCPATPRVKLPDFTTSESETEEQQLQEASAGTNNALESTRAASPPPNCAICLGRCKNKCFTDSCMHQFCFKCLCEWSKIKPECPLCKQTFKSIIHNVKSFDQFEEYHVQQPSVQIPNRPVEVGYEQIPYIVENVFSGRGEYEILAANWIDPRLDTLMRTHVYPHFPERVNAYNRNGRPQNNLVQTQYTHRGEVLNMYRQENPDGTSGTLSQLWRRYVYDRKLFALPVYDITGRVRESNARFYRDNPSQLHRLMPWINRDIVCLLRNTEHSVTTVLERISETLTQFDIISVAFRRRVHSYLGEKTAHFIHELTTFARSPYDMIGYDRVVQYAPQVTEEVILEFSSSTESSDEEMNTMNNVGDLTVPRSMRGLSNYRVQNRNNLPSSIAALMHFTVNTAADNTETTSFTTGTNNERNSQSTAINLSTHNRSNEDIIDLDAIEPSGSNNNNDTSTTNRPTTQPATTITFSDTDDEECEFVLELKPPHLRTPELVSLNSESDSDVVFINETQLEKPEDNSKQHEAEDNTEQFNIGASTSSGILSSGRQRWQKNMREKREKREKKSIHTRRRSYRSRNKRNKSNKSDNSSATCSTCSSDDSDHDDYARKRQAVKKLLKRNIRNVRRPPQKRPTKMQTRTRESNQRSRKRKMVSSDYSSTDEETLSSLKKRVEDQRNLKAATNSIKTENMQDFLGFSSCSTDSDDQTYTLVLPTTTDYCLTRNTVDNNVLTEQNNVNMTVEAPNPNNISNYNRNYVPYDYEAPSNSNSSNATTMSATSQLCVDTMSTASSTSSGTGSASAASTPTSTATLTSPAWDLVGSNNEEQSVPYNVMLDQRLYDDRYGEAAAVLAGFANTDTRFKKKIKLSADVNNANDTDSSSTNSDNA